MSAQEFTATLDLHGKTATGIEVPAAVVEALGGGKRPAVVAELGKHRYRTTIASMRGKFLIPVSAENREAAGLEAGDEVRVRITLDEKPREVAVPEDFAAAMAANPPARERFDALAFTHRKEHIRAIEEAKKAETRQRRIEKAIEKLLE